MPILFAVILLIVVVFAFVVFQSDIPFFSFENGPSEKLAPVYGVK